MRPRRDDRPCIAPIENPVEMGQTIETVITSLNDDPVWRRRFEIVYGDDGATRGRIGEALAAFVRGIEPPDSPYGAYLAGDEAALDDDARAGLDVFTGAGRCDACHAGPGLTDGLFHHVGPLIRIPPETREVERRAGDRTVRTFRRQRGSIGYGGIDVPEAQTLTLWDVARTAPYFRDAAADDLETAVRQHVQEMQDVVSNQEHKQHRELRVSEHTIPAALRPKREDDEAPPTPETLSDDDYAALMAFLESLSPTDRE